MSDFSVREFVESAPWCFAKTMPEAPHYYVVRTWVDPDDFDAMVAHIKRHGYRARWTSPSGNSVQVHTYFELDGWKYWHTHPVINRERLELSTTVRF